MTEKKLPEFVKVGAVVRSKTGDVTVQGEVARVDNGRHVYSPKGYYLGADDYTWELVTPAPKTLDEKVADFVGSRIGVRFTAGDEIVQRYLESVDRAGLKLVEK